MNFAIYTGIDPETGIITNSEQTRKYSSLFNVDTFSYRSNKMFGAKGTKGFA
jgi:hypothetical protein